jgi:pimeloyl-ACP methyl ester carboxylesterase
MQRVRSADGTMIAVDRSGQGPALVLITGAFTDRSSTKALASGLAERYTVYVFDRRGRGDSDQGGPYAIEREVEDLAAVIDAADGSAYGFGHSSGGALALEAAARGVPLRAVVVYEPPFTTGPTMISPMRWMSWQRPVGAARPPSASWLCLLRSR